MATTRLKVTIAVAMVVSGSINTISAKWADVTKSKNIEGKKEDFNHPFFQACGMFLGETLCMLAYYILLWRERRTQKPEENLWKIKQPFSPFIFFLPAMCDMTATSLMYVGLNWTYASVFQMLRGSVVIFTGIFSMVFLKRKIHNYMWFGMFCVLVGLALVGLASVVAPSSSSAPHPLLGDVVVIAAQLVVATQMVVEEKVLGRYDVPALQAVGYEGIFGFTVLSLLLIPMYYIPGDAVGNRLENAYDAFEQMKNSPTVVSALVLNTFSIAFFNFSGVSVTKLFSATTRMVLDSLRTITIWAFSLAVGWQDRGAQSILIQIGGFTVLLFGSLVYNKIFEVPFFSYPEPEPPFKFGEEPENNTRPLLHQPGSPPDDSQSQSSDKFGGVAASDKSSYGTGTAGVVRAAGNTRKGRN